MDSKVATLQLQIHYEDMTAHEAGHVLDNLLSGALAAARADSETGEPGIAIGSFFVQQSDPEEEDYLNE